MTTRRPWIVTALWTTARSAVLHTGLGWRGRPRRPPCVRGVDVDRDRRSRRVEAGAAVDAQHAPTAACKTRGRVSHSSHNASSLSCTRSTRRDYNRARTQGGTHATDSTTVATLRRVITITGLGVHDAPESPIKLAGMRISHPSAKRSPQPVGLPASHVIEGAAPEEGAEAHTIVHRTPVGMANRWSSMGTLNSTLSILRRYLLEFSMLVMVCGTVTPSTTFQLS